MTSLKFFDFSCDEQPSTVTPLDGEQSAVLDRREEDWAVILLTDQTQFNLPLAALPPRCQEGCHLILTFQNGTILTVRKDQQATRAAKKRIANLLADLEIK